LKKNTPFIDLGAQYQRIKNSVDTAVLKVLESNNYIQGEQVFLLEERLASYVGVDYCVTCSSGTDALLMCLMAQGVGKGDAVFTTPFTFVATVEVIALLGATPVFVDVDERTYNMCANSLAKNIDEVLSEGLLKPKGIIPVDLFGQPADYEPINQLAEANDLWVLEDAAQSFGAEYKGKKTGSLAEMAATSFFPAKPLGCYGDGGAVFTNNKDMHTIQAAVLLEKLKIYDDEIKLRNAVADKYSSYLNGGLTVPYIVESNTSVWAQYSVLAKSSDHRDQIRSALSEQNIPSAVYYPIPVHLASAYNYLGYKKGDFPVSEYLSSRIFSLPMHPYLEADTQEEIIEIINQSLSE